MRILDACTALDVQRLGATVPGTDRSIRATVD